MFKHELIKIITVITAVALVIAGSWYATKQSEHQAIQVNSPASSGQVIILDAGHGGST